MLIKLFESEIKFMLKLQIGQILTMSSLEFCTFHILIMADIIGFAESMTEKSLNPRLKKVL